MGALYLYKHVKPAQPQPHRLDTIIEITCFGLNSTHRLSLKNKYHSTGFSWNRDDEYIAFF